MATKLNAKLGNMRKVKEWTVYPARDDGALLIQTSDRIALIDPIKKKAILSAAVKNGAYFVHLNPVLGATLVDVTDEVIVLATALQPQKGDQIGPGIYVG